MNSKLESEIQYWKTSGSQKQDGVDWSPFRKGWLVAFPLYADFINSLPDIIDRELLRALCEDSNLSAVEKFLSVMIWGYSELGYGTFRVAELLRPAHSLAKIEQAAWFSAQGQPKAAYEFLMKNRIPILGPSYAAKFICFMTPKEVSAPILDSLVLKWIKKYGVNDFDGLSISKMSWNLQTYSFYCDWIESHARQNDCFPEEVELVLFRLAEKEFSIDSKWRGK